MSKLKQSLRRIPYWAYLLVLVANFVITTYLYYRGQSPVGGGTVKFENGYYIHEYVQFGGPVYNAGIRTGDTLVSINSVPIKKWEISSVNPRAGDTLIVGILRNNKEIQLPSILVSDLSSAPGFFWSIYIIMVLFSLGSLYLLYKKPHKKTVLLLFIYIQFFIISVNAQLLYFDDPLTMVTTVIFLVFSCFLGPILIHFHLLFPGPTKIINRYHGIPLLFYVPATLIAAGFSGSYILDRVKSSLFSPAVFNVFMRVSLWWLTISFIIALAVAIYQFFSIRDTLSRNQLRIVITGAFFSCITPISLALFYDRMNELEGKIPNLIPLAQGIGGLIMICCILIAIFRYRIWDVEVFIRKALLYLGATMVIILSYLFLLWIVDRLIISENNFIRFIILGVSVVIFLVLRDRIQRLIDRIFHRETYDSATVVSDFEAKLAGIYRFDELKEKIVQSIDEIFHFKSFVFNLKKNGLIYEPAFIYGTHMSLTGSEYEINRELEEKLQNSKIFSPEELNKKPSILEETTGEVVVPLISDGQPNGFFICGQKKSERIYSRQDIQVLRLLAQRVVSLLHTAGLYQKDLDRQLMLERERARISQDMHDDVGASLTRISILSELAKNNAVNKQWLGQISDTSREVMEEMNQIIWALNPKNDTLEGLIAYIRRFANEYLEPTSVNCSFDLPEKLPKLALTVEVRRNIYLVVREALHNAVKHSGAKQVTISINMNEHGFIVILKDDGKGFDPSNLEFPGNGLVNMKKRIVDVGGDFQIKSTRDEGTVIELCVPLK